MIESIKNPSDLNNLSKEELTALAAELRETILSVVSRRGGHLASNLGVVETTIALLRTFHFPTDTLFFDVGHQCYAYKLLTRRWEAFQKLRQLEGTSGFPNPEESEYDAVFTGHTGSALSLALGAAEANDRAGSNAWTVCVVGDGSLTNGMLLEAMNNCCHRKNVRLLIVLNDNEMSISKNVGGFSKYLNHVRTSRRYHGFKRRLENFLLKIPLVGKGLASFAKKTKDFVKNLLRQKTVFEDLGIPYLGIVDGTNLDSLEEAFQEGKRKDGICLVHVVSKKGMGYQKAMEHPEQYHSVGAFDLEKGVLESPKKTFSSVLGDTLSELSEKNACICAVSAAMLDGTGLASFAQDHPNNCYDVGIAEEHAVAFAAGLSLRGYKPVCALYSTFSQRVYDQLFQDVCLQKIPFVLTLDRAGIVSGDGRMHQGIYDVALFSSLPAIEIWSPDSFEDEKNELIHALTGDKQTIVRYSKGTEPSYNREAFVWQNDHVRVSGPETSSVAVITYGRVTANVVQALEKENLTPRIVKLERVAPLDFKEIKESLGQARKVFVVEEGVLVGGVGERIASMFCNESEMNVDVRAIENRFLPQGTESELFDMTGLSVASLAKWFKEKYED